MSQFTANRSMRRFAYYIRWLDIEVEAFETSRDFLVQVDEVCRLLGLDVIRETYRLVNDLGARIEIIRFDNQCHVLIRLHVLFEWAMYLDIEDVLPEKRKTIKVFQTAARTHLSETVG